MIKPYFAILITGDGTEHRLGIKGHTSLDAMNNLLDTFHHDSGILSIQVWRSEKDFDDLYPSRAEYESDEIFIS